MSLRFKEYNQQQNWLFPPSIEELIPPDHPVRIVNGVVEQLDLTLLTKAYYAEGKPSFHPKMMLKVMVYAYMDNIYSSRRIEKAMRENINFMWLSGKQVADHNTIARFRTVKLGKAFKDVFKQVVLLLAQEGLVTLKQVFTDGTKIESVAGRYTFVWGNGIKNRQEKMAQELEKMWEYAQSVAEQEDNDPPEPPSSKGKLDPERVAATAKKINEILKASPKASAKAKAKGRYIEKNYPTKLKEYQEQEELLQGRNSYSKTDPDATFMRMKDDHMKNGQLKPGYNVQISTENQIILTYSLHQQTNDIHTLEPHLKAFKDSLGQLPDELTADAGYGSEDNYKLLETLQITNYVKYPSFDKEQELANRHKESKTPFQRESLHYNQQDDYYVCPMGQHMTPIGTKKQTTKKGELQHLTIYKAQNCKGCPLRGLCHKAQGDRIIQRNHALELYKDQVRERLRSPLGIEKRKQRTADVEPVFAQIKHNRNFTRFTHKGIEKASIEFGLHALAHNIKKMSA